jgi:hypothetical protein
MKTSPLFDKFDPVREGAISGECRLGLDLWEGGPTSEDAAGGRKEERAPRTAAAAVDKA